MRVIMSWFLAWAEQRSGANLFKILLALFVLDVIVPDPIPFVDEAILGLLTLLVAHYKHPWRARKSQTPLRKK